VGKNNSFILGIFDIFFALFKCGNVYDVVYKWLWWPLFWLVRVRIMLFNATFNNISVISWWSLLLVEETRVPGRNHRPATSHWKTLSHNVVL